MNILVLAAGTSSSAMNETGFPIWLSEFDGQLLLERQIRAFDGVPIQTCIFAFHTKDVSVRHVDDIACQIFPGAKIVEVRRDTAGAACTALLAIGHLDLGGELMIVSATDHIDVDYPHVIQHFRDQRADCGILTFDSLHPRYSFVRVGQDGLVSEAAEKRPISRHANAGFYWYARAADFVDSVRRMILKDAHVNGVFYLSPSLNEMVLQGKRIATWTIPGTAYHPLKGQRHFDLLEHQLEERRRHAP